MIRGGETADVPPPFDVRALEDTVLGFRVNSAARYETAFRHKSLRDGPSYERLELMGDKVLDLIVVKFLFDSYPEADEGFLTRARNKLVNSKNLAFMAGALGLQRFVRAKNTRRLLENPRILEDVFEALVGAIYLDFNVATARDFVLGAMRRHLDWRQVMLDTNYKDILTRWAHAQGADPPSYQVLNSPDVDRAFHVRAALRLPCGGQAWGDGSHTTKKEAEQEAARSVLTHLGVPLDVSV